MKLVASGKLRPGMLVAQNAYTLDDQLVVTKGTVLDDKTIRRINNYSILNVFIEDEGSIRPVKPSDEGIVPQVSFSERLRASYEFEKFKASLEKSASKLKNTFDQIVNGEKEVDIEEITGPVYKLMFEAGTGFGVFDMLNNLHEYSDEIYMHSINVSLISNLIAGWMKYTPDEIKIATAAGLLHDIGKVKLPINLINSTNSYSEKDRQILRTHVIQGYELLKNMDIDDHIKNAVVMHHERADGSGYPFHIRGEQIDEFARIIAVADIYDELTSKRMNRGPICAFDVIEMFEKEGLNKFDAKVVMTFMTHISNSFIANKVRLSDGREGDIIFINPDKLSRPMVKCGDMFVDLASHPRLKIVEII